MSWSLLGIIYAVTAVLSSIGFYKFVYFLSIGYGLAVLGGGITVFVIYMTSNSPSPLFIITLEMLLFVIYGSRLSLFLIYRERKNAQFRKTDVCKDTLSKNSEKKMPFFVLLVIWIFVSALYTMQVSPMLFRVVNGKKDILVPIIGMAVSITGIILESVADSQKSKQKKQRPDMVATKGLYRMVRCPNYFGEITFWTGVFISGITAYDRAGEWIMAVIAYISIVYIMFNGAQRLEKRQMKRYKDNKEYTSYADSTPIIIPLLPVYHLNKKEEKQR